MNIQKLSNKLSNYNFTNKFIVTITIMVTLTSLTLKSSYFKSSFF